MKLCPNNHQNLDISRFCETCGSRLPDEILPDPTDNPVLDLDVVSATDNDLDVGEVDVTGIPDVETTDVSDPAGDASDDDNQDDDQDDDANSDTTDADDATATQTTDDDADADDSDDDQDPTIAAATNTGVTPPVVPGGISVASAATAVLEMKRWAGEWDVLDDPYVKGLETAVTSNNDLGMWSSLDPTQLLPEMPNQSNLFHRLGNGLAILRNVLVFLPVAITWQAISKATDAYTNWFPAADPATPNTEKNFLDFWANGYGVLPERYTLPHIGILDFWIIMVIIAMALVSNALVARGEVVNASMRNVFEAERLAVALKIRKALHGKREASPESIATSLADALSDLNQTTRDMAEVASRLESSTVGVQSLTPQLEKLNDHAGTFANDTSTAIAQAVQQLVASVEALNSSVSNNITSAFQAAVTSLQEVGEEMKRHSTSVEYGTRLLKDDIESIRQGLRR